MDTSLSMKQSSRVTFLPFIIFTLAASFYLYEFALQVSTSVMTESLMSTFHVDAAIVGFISACYFYAYSPMQLAAGLLFDRFGPRILISMALIVCAMGAVFFAVADTLVLAGIGRFFMGIGSAFSFIGVLVLVARWFPPQYFALLAGIAQLMSSIGAIAGEVPLAAAVKSVGWRPAMIWIGGIGIILSILSWLIIRDNPPNSDIDYSHAASDNEFARVLSVLRNPQTYYIALYAFAVWAPIMMFAALWGVPFLMRLYHLHLIAASSAVAMIWVGIGVGSPMLGWWSDRIGLRNVPLSISAGIGIVCTCTILYVHHLSLPLMYFFLFALGVAAGGQTVSFAVVKENNKAHHVGTATGINNFAVVMGGALFQPLVGWLLRFNWDGKLLYNIPIYSVHDYVLAMTIMPICYVVALLVSRFLIRETYCHAVCYE